MSKYESACIAYVRAQEDIKRLTGLIRLEIIHCVTAKAKASGSDPIEMEPCLRGHYRDTGLLSSIGWFGSGEVAPIECKFCQEADRLIQLRKAARKTFGAAKRQITVLGKFAIRQSEVNHGN